MSQAALPLICFFVDVKESMRMGACGMEMWLLTISKCGQMLKYLTYYQCLSLALCDVMQEDAPMSPQPSRCISCSLNAVLLLDKPVLWPDLLSLGLTPETSPSGVILLLEHRKAKAAGFRLHPVFQIVTWSSLLKCSTYDLETHFHVSLNQLNQHHVKRDWLSLRFYKVPQGGSLAAEAGTFLH